MVNRELVRFLEMFYDEIWCFKIDSIDNPGWSLKADNFANKTENQKFCYDLSSSNTFFNDNFKTNLSKNDDWIEVDKQDDKFIAYGDIFKLDFMLKFFINAVKGKRNREVISNFKLEIFSLIQEWFASKCDGEWEHEFGFDMRTKAGGWELCLNGESGKKPLQTKVKFNDGGVVRIEADEGSFKAFASKNKLSEAFRQLFKWLFDTDICWQKVLTYGDKVVVCEEVECKPGCSEFGVVKKGTRGEVAEILCGLKNEIYYQLKFDDDELNATVFRAFSLDELVLDE